MGSPPLPSAVSGRSKAGQPTAGLLARWPSTPRSQYPTTPSPLYWPPHAPKSGPARRNFQALGSKFNIAGRHSEATATAGTRCPSTEAWTSTDFATLRLGRPPGPAKTQGCNICQSASLSAWPNCPSFGCGFRVNASNFEFPPLCLEIPTRCQKSKNPKFG